MSINELLTAMFAVHGKRPMDAQFNEYLKIFDQLGQEKCEKLFQHVRDNEDRFPTIKQLWGIIKSLGLKNSKQKQLESYEDCYFCAGVGYVPYLLSPKRDKRVANYYTEVYACKCSAGQDIPKDLRRYFDTFDDLQFTETKEHCNYPQLVTIKQREYVAKFNKEKENGYTKRRRNRQDSVALDESKLRQELEKIAIGNTET